MPDESETDRNESKKTSQQRATEAAVDQVMREFRFDTSHLLTDKPSDSQIEEDANAVRGN